MTVTMRRPVHVAPASVTSALSTPWGDRISEVVPAGLTDGAFASYHVFASASARRPAYVNHAADEAFVVLGGAVTITVGGHDTFFDLRAGAAVYVPRGASRSFRTGPSGAWLLVTQTPGKQLDGLLAVLSTASADPADAAYGRLGTALAEHGIELLRPSGPKPCPGGRRRTRPDQWSARSTADRTPSVAVAPCPGPHGIR